MPYAVKNLFDVAGLPTLAGSKVHADARRRRRATPRWSRACATAGAILVGALNMDEFAYGFTTENSHYGVTRNPHGSGAHCASRRSRVFSVVKP